MNLKRAILSLLGIGLIVFAGTFLFASEDVYEGCTPGYWKNHLDSWPAAYTPGMLLGNAFDVTNWPVLCPDIMQYATYTMEEALNFKGGKGVAGGARIFLRHATAALLNGAHGGVAYWDEHVVQVVVAVHLQAECSKSSLVNAAGYWEFYNELGCPLGNNK